jgi:hypothetical protein
VVAFFADNIGIGVFWLAFYHVPNSRTAIWAVFAAQGYSAHSGDFCLESRPSNYGSGVRGIGESAHCSLSFDSPIAPGFGRSFVAVARLS